jgi:hypothetical protein
MYLLSFIQKRFSNSLLDPVFVTVIKHRPSISSIVYPLKMKKSPLHPLQHALNSGLIEPNSGQSLILGSIGK